MEIPLLLENHPEKIPIVCIHNSDITKLLISRYLTLNQFIYFFRRSKKINKNHIMYVQIEGNQILGLNQMIGEIYQKFKSEDQVLYINITNEAYLGGFTDLRI